MISRLKKAAVILLSLGALFSLPVLAPVAAYAQTGGTVPGISCGVELKYGTDCPDPGLSTGDKISALIKTVINIFSIVVGVVAVFMIIVGGLKYITSGGDSGNISTAKNTILYALIGLVIVALAQFIVHFVLRTVGTVIGQ